MYLTISSFTVGPFAENSYLLTCSATGAAVFVDPGDDAELLWQAVEDAGGRLDAIVLTHAHLDHVAALTDMRQRSGALVYLHPADDALLTDTHLFWQQFGRSVAPIAPADRALHDGQVISFGNVTLQVIFTPGHSPGSVCFYAPQEQVLIAGDTLFRRSIGRTDLPGGDAPTLVRSVRERLFTLPEPALIRVYPGHGLPTTIREEMEENPFVGIRRNA